MPTRHLAAFLLTAYALILIPGPSVIFVVSRGVALGRGAAIATVVGNASGLALQLVLVALGLGSLITRSRATLAAFSIAGGAYMALLGWRTIRDRERHTALLTPTDVSDRPLAVLIREGFVVGATNPKGAVIFTAVLPRFIDRGAGDDTTQLLLLGTICVAIALASDGSWALAAGAARRWFGRSRRRLEALTLLGGVTLIGLGLALAVAGVAGAAG
jgi:threonine/homoserine/homoserine lactone efflux protein